MKGELSQIGEILKDVLLAHADGFRAGNLNAEQHIHPALRALEMQYRKAQADKLACLPTALELAIVNVLSLLPARLAKPEWHDRADLDLDICGRSLKAGT